MNPKRITPRHSIIEIQKVKGKDRILEATRGMQLITYKGAPKRLSNDFSTETLQPEGIGKKYSK